jgi:hypothetical protein
VCADGRQALRYQVNFAAAASAQLVFMGDITADGIAEALFSAQTCGDPCTYQTQVVTWNRDLGRFTSLVGEAILSEQIPLLRDVDNDRVTELVIQQEDDGNAQTGPRRTGTFIYDWNGALYVPSIIELDPPRYAIQVIHEADRYFSAFDMRTAIPLYTQVLAANAGLRNWYNDDGEVLRTYAQYRLMLAYAYIEDPQGIVVYQDLTAPYPDPAAAPPFVAMGITFWATLQTSANLNTSCQEVVCSAPPRALELLNRYGSESPTYTQTLLCPF